MIKELQSLCLDIKLLSEFDEEIKVAESQDEMTIEDHFHYVDEERDDMLIEDLSEEDSELTNQFELDFEGEDEFSEEDDSILVEDIDLDDSLDF